MPQPITLKTIKAIPVTESEFKPYGQLITPAVDGKAFDRTDAILSLENGIPRFYIMGLSNRGRTFGKIPRHHSCTQCIGSLKGNNWYLAVCLSNKESVPDLSLLEVFRI